VACWRTKAAIYLKPVKIEEKLLWTAYRNSPTLFRMVPSPTSYGLLFLKIGGLQLSYPLSSQEQVKLRTSNLTSTFTGPIQVKPIQNLRENGAWAYPGTAQIFGYPLLSQERVKLRTSNFVGTFIGSIGTKDHENVGNSGRGHSQGLPKIFRAPICRAHCTVVFAIAQLSCSRVTSG